MYIRQVISPHAKWKVHLTRWQVHLDMAKRALATSKLDLSNKLACAIRDDEATITPPPPRLVKMVFYGPQYNGILVYFVLVITGYTHVMLDYVSNWLIYIYSLLNWSVPFYIGYIILGMPYNSCSYQYGEERRGEGGRGGRAERGGGGG